jgi:hypothetical protein
MKCENCSTTHATIFKVVDDRTLCAGCAGAEENRKIAAANAPSAAQLKIWEEQRDSIERLREAERRQPPRPSIFCEYPDCAGHVRVPAIAIVNGVPSCASHLAHLAEFHPEALIFQLQRRIEALEQAMASKASRKAGAQ